MHAQKVLGKPEFDSRIRHHDADEVRDDCWQGLISRVSHFVRSTRPKTRTYEQDKAAHTLTSAVAKPDVVSCFGPLIAVAGSREPQEYLAVTVGRLRAALHAIAVAYSRGINNCGTCSNCCCVFRPKWLLSATCLDGVKPTVKLFLSGFRHIFLLLLIPQNRLARPEKTA